jgi:hypothetical protein
MAQQDTAVPLVNPTKVIKKITKFSAPRNLQKQKIDIITSKLEEEVLNDKGEIISPLRVTFNLKYGNHFDKKFTFENDAKYEISPVDDNGEKTYKYYTAKMRLIKKKDKLHNNDVHTSIFILNFVNNENVPAFKEIRGSGSGNTPEIAMKHLELQIEQEIFTPPHVFMNKITYNDGEITHEVLPLTKSQLDLYNFALLIFLHLSGDEIIKKMEEGDVEVGTTATSQETKPDEDTSGANVETGPLIKTSEHAPVDAFGANEATRESESNVLVNKDPIGGSRRRKKRFSKKSRGKKSRKYHRK